MYLINREKQIFVVLSKTDEGEYGISDWRDIETNFKKPDTVLGYRGERLFKWLYEHKYEHMTNEERMIYELAK